MRDIIFEFKAFEQCQEWIKTDRKVSIRINALIIEAAKNPFEGRGKPEPLKENWKGY